jgi:hypothetical protein
MVHKTNASAFDGGYFFLGHFFGFFWYIFCTSATSKAGPQSCAIPGGNTPMNDRACCGLACATFIVGTVALQSGARYHLTTSPLTMNHLSSMHCHPLSSIEPLLLPLLRIIVFPLSEITQNNANYLVNMFCIGSYRYFC